MIDFLKNNWKGLAVCAAIFIGAVAFYSAGCVKGCDISKEVQESEIVN